MPDAHVKMSKIVGQMICHYGVDFIAYALRSIAPFVDELFVFYTDIPSHGTPSPLPCPDSPEQMRAAILGAGVGDKLRLIEGRWNGEGEHRNQIFNYTSPGDLIIVADADEVWDSKNLQACIDLMNAMPDKKFLKVRMTNLWRSFNFICTDPMTQDRLVRVGASGGIVWSPTSALPEYPDIWHLGYARKPVDIEYKLSCHGHIGSIFPEWYQSKFLAWTPANGVTDCHPDCRDFWYPKSFDKNLLPDDLKSHSYFNLDIIA